MAFTTALLTRFNVKTGPTANPKATSPSWLHQRLDLFETITLPAIKAQKRRPDMWLVFFDAATPALSRERIEALQAAFPLMQPVFCDVLTPAVYKQAIGDRLPPNTDWLITTRIDNDDALPPTTLREVYSTAQPGTREFINPLRGLIVAGQRAYRKRDGLGRPAPATAAPGAHSAAHS